MVAESKPTRDPRNVALTLLEAVLERDRPLDEALKRQKAMKTLSPRDRAFVRNLTATTLRRLGQIDALLDHCLDRPIKASQSVVMNILRLGAAQLLFLETPPHAGVDTSVTLAVTRRVPAARGLINAVLRRLAREGATRLAEQDAPRLNTPAWLWDSWQAAYGEATTRALAEAHLVEPPLDLTIKADPEVWAERLEATILPTGSLRLPPGRGAVDQLPGYDEGAWWVQDAAAALPAQLLDLTPGARVFDLCAAPGGKTAQLAAAGYDVTAVEKSPERLALLAQNLTRLGLAASCVTADAIKWQPEVLAEGILLDAPCSATGTLRRHPDIARRQTKTELAGLTALQDRLLRHSVTLLRPGGVLVYATCSLQPEEGPARVAALLADCPGLRRRPIAAGEVGGLAALITPEGDLRSLPCHLAELGGLDGFYACRLEVPS